MNRASMFIYLLLVVVPLGLVGCAREVERPGDPRSSSPAADAYDCRLSDRHGSSHGNANRDADAHPHISSHSNPHVSANPYGNAHAIAIAIANRDARTHGHSRAHPDPYRAVLGNN